MTQENDTAVMVLPVLPLKNTVLFPHLFMPLSVGRPQLAGRRRGRPGHRGQDLRGRGPARRLRSSSPALDDLYTVGTRAVIKKMARGENGIELLVQGVERVAIAQGRADRAVPQGPRAGRCRCRTTAAPRSRRCTGAVLELAAQALSLAQLPTPINIAASSRPRPATRCAWPT